MYILYMLVLNNTPFVHLRVYLQYFNSALPGGKIPYFNEINIRNAFDFGQKTGF